MKDIQGGVDVSVDRKAAIRTAMNTDGQTLRHKETAPRANLAGAVGVNLDHHPTSSPSHIGQRPVEEQTPACVQHLLAQVPLSQAVHVQILDDDKPEPPTQVPCQLPVEILSLSSKLKVKLSYLFTHPFPSFTAFPLLAQDTLFFCQLSFSFLIPAGVFDNFPVRKGKQVLNTNVYSDGGIQGRKQTSEGILRDINRKGNIPAVRLLRYPCLFDSAFGKGTVPENLDQTDVLDVEAVLLDSKTIVVDEFQGPKAVRFLKAGIARFLPCFKPPEEGLKGLIQPSKDLLTSREVQSTKLGGIPQFLKLCSLVVVADTFTVLLPGFPSLGQGCVVKPAAKFKELPEGPLLVLARIEPILVRSKHLPTFLSFDIPLYYFLANLTQGTDVIASAPKRGKSAFEFGKSPSKDVGSVTLDAVGNLSWRQFRRHFHEKVDMIWLNFQGYDRTTEFFYLLVDELFQTRDDVVYKDRSSVLGTPDKMIADMINSS